MNLSALNSLVPTSGPASADLTPRTAGPSFADTLAGAANAVNTLQWQAQGGARSLADGTAANVHDVTIALEQANIALQLTATVRNKVIEAYQEIMRMQV